VRESKEQVTGEEAGLRSGEKKFKLDIRAKPYTLRVVQSQVKDPEKW